MQRLIAANIDVVVHVVSVKAPPLRVRLIDRYLIAIQRGGAQPVVCVNKIDLLDDPAELAWLESLLHSRVAREYMAWREALGRLPEPPAVAVTEVPLLYEVGGERRFDVVVAITAPAELRATDLDWSYGAGEPLTGTAQDLLLVLCGRRLPAA